MLFTLSPYYHYNNAHYLGGPNDTPYILNDNITIELLGGRAVLQMQKKRHNARAGIEIWGQHDNTFFGLTANPGGNVFNQTERHWANSDAVFLEDQYKATSWLTFDFGLRLTHYSGLVNENAADPRLGAAIRIPKINWILHGYYAYYYQPPPLDSLAGPALQFAVTEGFNFTPLPGERDIQHDIGLTIPLRGWSLDLDQFHTSARNFLDHDVVGDSGIFIPLTDLGAIIHGTEITVRSPTLFRVAQWRVAYSNQIAQGIGPITGGLLEFAPHGKFPARSRPAQHGDLGFVVEAPWSPVDDACLSVWLRISQRQRSGAPATPFDIRSFCRQTIRRKLDDLRERGQHRQHTVSTRYQQHIRRNALHQSPANLWRTKISVSLLGRHRQG